MLPYSLLMFLAAAALLVLGLCIYRGNTGLINHYHQTRVTDRRAYGRAFGRALMALGAGPAASGGVALLGDSDKIAIAAVIVLMAGILLGFLLIFWVQKKYNNGLF